LSLLSTMGWFVMGLSLIGFLAGMAFALPSGNYLGSGLAFLGLLGGTYIGYLGVKVDEIDQRDPSREFEKIDGRLSVLEEETSRLMPSAKGQKVKGQKVVKIGEELDNAIASGAKFVGYLPDGKQAIVEQM